MVWSAVRHPQRRGLLLPNGIINLQTRCSHRASPHAQSRASPGSLFLRAWRSVCFLQQTGPALSTGTRIGRMRRCSFSTVAYTYRPTTACPLHRSHSRSVRPVQLLFFFCGRWNPATDVEKERVSEKERQNLLAVHTQWVLNGSSTRSMFNVQYIVHTRTRTHAQTNLVHGTGRCSVHCAVRREAYTVSQSTSPSDPVSWAARWGFTTATRSPVNNRRAALPRFPLGSSLRACA